MNDLTTEFIYIYCLRCPLSKDVMYVGKSNKPDNRYISHIIHSKKDNPWHIGAVNVWIKSLVDNGLKPKLDILDICEKQYSTTYEKSWIRFYSKRNVGLLNKAHNPNYNKCKFKPNRDFGN